MSKQSFNVERSLRLKPIDPTTLTTPKNGELICDSTDSNKLKKYNEGNSTWEQVTSTVSLPGSSLFIYQTRVASTGNITLSGIPSNTLTDGVTVIAGDRVLLKNQTATAENGVYTVGTPWARVTDMATWTQTISYMTLISEGTIWSGMCFSSSTTIGGTLGVTAIGWNAEGSGTSSTADTVLGYSALNANTTGVNNSAIGTNTLILNTTGSNNAAVGTSALAANTTASDSTAVGYRALLNSTAAGTTAVGSQALATNSSGTGNIAVGFQSSYLNLTGARNIAIGYQASYTNSLASDNVAVGYQALNLNTASFITAVGSTTLAANTTGTRNTGVGFASLLINSVGSSNTAVGCQSLGSNNGSNNTAVGNQALITNSSGTSNTAIGNNALFLNQTTSNNTAVGYQALYNNVVSNSVAVGYQALYTNTTGNQNTAVGYTALFANLGGSVNDAFGYGALAANISGNYNLAIGSIALNLNQTGVNNIGIGFSANKVNISGNYNIAIGTQSLFNNTVSSNIAIGSDSLYSNTTGDSNLAIGLSSLFTNISGTQNIAIGYNALHLGTGNGNVVIGYNAGSAITTGASNVIVGSHTGSTIAALSNNILLADGAGNLRMSFDSTGIATLYKTLKFNDNTTNTIGIVAPAAVTSYTLTLPALQGAASTVLTNNGSGVLTWAAGSGGAGGIQKIDVVDTALTTVPTGVSATIDGVALTNGMLVLFTALSVNPNQVYLVSGVGTSLVFTAQLIFTGAAAPTTGDMLYVKSGTGFTAQTIFFNGTIWDMLRGNYKVVTAGAALSAGQLAYISVGNTNGDTGNTLGSAYAYAPFTLYKSQPIGFVKYAVTTGQKALIQVSGIFTLASTMASTDYGRRVFALTSTTFSTANTSTQRSNAGFTVHPWGIYETSLGTMLDTTNISVNVQSNFIPSYVRSTTTLVNVVTDVDTTANLPTIASMTDGVYCVLDYTVVMTNTSAAVKTQTGQVIAWKGDNVNWDYSHTFNIAIDIGFRLSVTAAGVIQYIAPTATIGSITNLKIHSINNRG